MRTAGNLTIIAVAALASGALAADAPKATYGFGSTPTDAELARFFSPLPDGRGLPPGSGSVLEGKSVYQQHSLSAV